MNDGTEMPALPITEEPTTKSVTLTSRCTLAHSTSRRVESIKGLVTAMSLPPAVVEEVDRSAADIDAVVVGGSLLSI